MLCFHAGTRVAGADGEVAIRLCESATKCVCTAGLKQENVDRELDITQSAVSKLETGTGDLSLRTLAEYCQAIGYRPVVLLVPATASAYDAAAYDAAAHDRRRAGADAV